MHNQSPAQGVSPNVFVGSEVDSRRIAADAALFPGCRLGGGRTLICQGAELGREAPVTLINCYVGPDVKLKGGYFENATFLEGAQAGSGSHVRQGCILEEQASIAHTVGLKQTILFPFVTLGSLINFCDCLMAGGTDRANHSEVGSAYIHFNYTPNQDKATASLIGDVANGVMLDNAPIFLGGQGGLVGPCRLTYGTVIAAGSVYRKDQLEPDRLLFEGIGRGGSLPYTAGIYRNVRRQAVNNFHYMANLVALKAWYTHVRHRFIGARFPQALYDGLIDTLGLAIEERIKRFVAFCGKMEVSRRRYLAQSGGAGAGVLVQQKEQLYANREGVADCIQGVLGHMDDLENRSFSRIIDNRIKQVGSSYLDVVRSLAADERNAGSAWLQQIVDDVVERFRVLFPALR